MRYTCEVTIDKPREEVQALFDNPENMLIWQPTLKKYEVVEGNKHEDGVKSKFTYDQNGKEVILYETVEKFNYPDQMIAIYEADKMWNRCVNDLIDLGDKTIWRIDSEFIGSGFMKVVCFLGKSMFVKQTMKDLNAFKVFAESQ